MHRLSHLHRTALLFISLVLAGFGSAARNADSATVDWQFTTADARIKLRCLYPSVSA
jgi:hypothetical protein